MFNVNLSDVKTERIVTNLDPQRNPADLRGQVFIDYTKMESIYLPEVLGSALSASFPGIVPNAETRVEFDWLAESLASVVA
jgi:hypothetical protein